MNPERYFLLDAFRGIAALAVLALHALSNVGRAEWLPTAHLAVDFSLR